MIERVNLVVKSIWSNAIIKIYGLNYKFYMNCKLIY